METNALDLQGKRFYSPRVLLLYSVLANFPIALFLYGINVHRRGSPFGGNIVKGLAAVMIVMITLIAAVGTHVKAAHLILIGVAIGIGLMQVERSHYDDCLARGASPEKWWPPLIFLLLQSILVFVLAGRYDS